MPLLFQGGGAKNIVPSFSGVKRRARGSSDSRRQAKACQASQLWRSAESLRVGAAHCTCTTNKDSKNVITVHNYKHCVKILQKKSEKVKKHNHYGL